MTGNLILQDKSCALDSYTRIKPNYSLDRSKEYWTGRAIAYYQWETRLRFSEITNVVPITQILEMYDPYHEMDIRQFTDKMNELLGPRM